MGGAFGGTGQKCTASSRLIVTEGIHDRFVEAMVERMKKLVVGHPLKAGVHIGAVADARQMEQNLRYWKRLKPKVASWFTVAMY